MYRQRVQDGSVVTQEGFVRHCFAASARREWNGNDVVLCAAVINQRSASFTSTQIIGECCVSGGLVQPDVAD
jgi:hypothetical protein